MEPEEMETAPGGSPPPLGEEGTKEEAVAVEMVEVEIKVTETVGAEVPPSSPAQDQQAVPSGEGGAPKELQAPEDPLERRKSTRSAKSKASSHRSHKSHKSSGSHKSHKHRKSEDAKGEREGEGEGEGEAKSPKDGSVRKKKHRKSKSGDSAAGEEDKEGKTKKKQHRRSRSSKDKGKGRAEEEEEEAEHEILPAEPVAQALPAGTGSQLEGNQPAPIGTAVYTTTVVTTTSPASAIDGGPSMTSVRIADGFSDDELDRRRMENEEERRRMERKQSDYVTVGKKVDESNENYVLMYVMLLGIRTTLSRCHAKPPRPLTEEDFTSAHKLAFDIAGKEMTPSSKYDFKFKDYCPWVFRNLRERFNLDAADYLVSLTGRYVLSELGNLGKSGSFFYYSQDYRFIIKTIRHTEHKFFMSILKKYYEYVMNNPDTLICRFYGLHRVKLSHRPKIHFVVLGNVFPPNRDIHETYDLKGSTFGRYVEPRKDGKSQILKDLNFTRKIKLGPQKHQLFVEQIKKDAAFLASVYVMDYSLLLGIHNLSRGNSELLRDRGLTVYEPPTNKRIDRTMSRNERKAMRRALSQVGPVALDASKAKLPQGLPKERLQSVFYHDGGGFQSTDENNRPLPEVYHMGIIDILTPYNALKRAEHLFLSINHNPNEVSCVAPPQYAERFVNFLVNGTTDHSKKKEKKKGKRIEEEDSVPEMKSPSANGVY